LLSAGISLPRPPLGLPSLEETNKHTNSLPSLAAVLGLQTILTPAMNQDGIMNNLYEACHSLLQSFFSSEFSLFGLSSTYMSDYFKDFMSGRLQVQHYMESGFSG
jgi:hypothetical protein